MHWQNALERGSIEIHVKTLLGVPREVQPFSCDGLDTSPHLQPPRLKSLAMSDGQFIFVSVDIATVGGKPHVDTISLFDSAP